MIHGGYRYNSTEIECDFCQVVAVHQTPGRPRRRIKYVGKYDVCERCLKNADNRLKFAMLNLKVQDKE